MKKERMIEELARIGGFTFSEKTEHNTYPYGWTVRAKTWFDRLNNKVHCSDLPDYLNDHNACQILIAGMTNEVMARYANHLFCVCGAGMHNVYTATPWQKCEAILKAYGKWED